jgi:hypothetical protein
MANRSDVGNQTWLAIFIFDNHRIKNPINEIIKSFEPSA